MSSSDNKERYLAAYQEARWRAAARPPAWLDKLRESAIANFKTLGFPTLKNEDWKYTNVEPITAQQYVSANGEGKQVSAGDFMARSLIDPGATRLVFVNGVFRPDLSQTAMLGREIVVTTL